MHSERLTRASPGRFGGRYLGCGGVAMRCQMVSSPNVTRVTWPPVDWRPYRATMSPGVCATTFVMGRLTKVKSRRRSSADARSTVSTPEMSGSRPAQHELAAVVRERARDGSTGAVEQCEDDTRNERRVRRDHRPAHGLRAGALGDHERRDEQCVERAHRPEPRTSFRRNQGYCTRGITCSAKRSISSSWGLHCNSSRPTPASRNSRMRSATCSAVPTKPARRPRLDTE